VYQGVESEMLLEPRRIGILRFLIYGERYRPDQSHADHGRSNSSKKATKSFRLIGMADAIGKATVLVCLHTSLDRVQRKLITVRSVIDRPSEGRLTAANVESTLLAEAATSVRYRFTHLFCFAAFDSSDRSAIVSSRGVPPYEGMLTGMLVGFRSAIGTAGGAQSSRPNYLRENLHEGSLHESSPIERAGGGVRFSCQSAQVLECDC
jgi:hypothetical protein